MSSSADSFLLNSPFIGERRVNLICKWNAVPGSMGRKSTLMADEEEEGEETAQVD